MHDLGGSQSRKLPYHSKMVLFDVHVGHLLVMTNIAIENGPVEILSFQIKDGDFQYIHTVYIHYTYICKSLPEGIFLVPSSLPLTFLSLELSSSPKRTLRSAGQRRLLWNHRKMMRTWQLAKSC